MLNISKKIKRVVSGVLAFFITLGLFSAAAFAAESDELEPVTSVVDVYYTDTTSFTQALKDALKENEETIELYYVAESVNDIPTDAYTQAMAHTGTADEGDYLWSVINTDSFNRMIEDCGEFREGCLYKYVFTVTYYTTKSQEDYVDAKVSSIVSSLGISGKSDYEKVEAIYDYMTENFKQYDGGSYADRCSAYVLLKNSKGNCRAFSALFYRLCLSVGIDARIVRSNDHAWNIVKVDGAYYCVDSMWGTVDADAYFLKGTTSFMANHAAMKNSCFYSYSVSAADYDVPVSSTSTETSGTGSSESTSSSGSTSTKTTTAKSEAKTSNTGEEETTAKSNASSSVSKSAATAASEGEDNSTETKPTLAALHRAYIEVFYAREWTSAVLQTR